MTFSVQVTTPAGLGIVDTTIDFGDGKSSDLGGATSTSVEHTYAAGTFTVKVTVTDTTGTTTTGTTFISVSS